MPDQTQYLLNFGEFGMEENQNSNYSLFFHFQKMIHIKLKGNTKKTIMVVYNPLPCQGSTVTLFLHQVELDARFINCSEDCERWRREGDHGCDPGQINL